MIILTALKIINFIVKFFFKIFLLELDALGDDLAFDEDTSYLDEAEKAPTVPDTDLPEPGGTKVMCI